MRKMSEIIETAASAAECCIFVRLFNGYLGFKNNGKKLLKSIIFFILCLAINIFLSTRKGLENLSIITLTLLFLAYSFAFLNGRIFEKLLAAVIPVVGILPINLIVINIFCALAGNNPAEIMPGGSMRVYVLFFSKTISFFVCETILKGRKKQSCALNKFQMAIELSYFLISFLITAVLWNISGKQAENSFAYAVIFLLITLLNAIIYVLMSKTRQYNDVIEEYKLMKANFSAQEKLAAETKKRYNEIKTLRHDMKHCFSAAASLISDNKLDEAKAYIESVIKERIAPVTAGVSTENAVIDAVINNKIAAAADKGLEIKCSIDICRTEIKDVDISVLISNLLDNAINGCDISRPIIELDIKRKNAFLSITVKNSISKCVLKSNPELRTQNKDKDEHGFGIKSIKAVADKYGGHAAFSESDGCFTAQVWLNTNL